MPTMPPHPTTHRAIQPDVAGSTDDWQGGPPIRPCRHITGRRLCAPTLRCRRATTYVHAHRKRGPHRLYAGQRGQGDVADGVQCDRRGSRPDRLEEGHHLFSVPLLLPSPVPPPSARGSVELGSPIVVQETDS